MIASGPTNAVVLGELNGGANIGAHNAALSSWQNLSLQAGGGNVGIGTTSPAAALDVGSGKVAMGWERIANACGSTTICTATCSAGKKALGGGCRVTNTWARQTEEPADTSYTCYTDVTTTLTAQVYCANMQ